jgi:hypothetical protein
VQQTMSLQSAERLQENGEVFFRLEKKMVLFFSLR